MSLPTLCGLLLMVAAPAPIQEISSEHFTLRYVEGNVTAAFAREYARVLEGDWSRLPAAMKKRLHDDRGKKRISARIVNLGARRPKLRYLGILQTDRFLLKYRLTDTDPLWALRTLYGFEHGWDVIKATPGFTIPDFLKSPRPEIYLFGEKLGKSTWGAARIVRKRVKNAAGKRVLAVGARCYVNLATMFAKTRSSAKNRDRVLLATCVHELFHQVQFSYERPRTTERRLKNPFGPYLRARWLYEGTARWIEHRAVPYEATDWMAKNVAIDKPGTWANHGYLNGLGYWMTWGHASEGISIPDYTYLDAVVFEYLAEREGDAVVADIWKRVKAGDKALVALRTAVGGEARLRDRLADFSAALAVLPGKRNAAYRFRGVEDHLIKDVEAKLEASAPYFPLFPGRRRLTLQHIYEIRDVGGKATLRTFSSWTLRPLSVKIFGFRPRKPPFSGAGKPPKDYVPPDLWVALYARDHAPWGFRLVSVARDQKSGWTVATPAAATHPESRIARIRGFGREAAEVILAVAHANLSGKKKFFFAAVFSPPVFTDIEISDRTDPGVTSVVWRLRRTRDSAAGTWKQTPVAAGPLELNPVRPTARKLFLRVRASRSMQQVACRLVRGAGHVPIALAAKGADRMTWEAALPANTVWSCLASGPPAHLALELRGLDVNKTRTDPNPLTEAILRKDDTFTGWEEIGKADGGWETHRVPVTIDPPPHLVDLTVRQTYEKKATPYSAEWIEAPGGAGRRSLTLKSVHPYHMGPSLNACRLRFSRPMDAATVRVGIEGVEIGMTMVREDKVFEGVLPSGAAFEKVLGEGRPARIRVEGKSSAGLALDADPRSVPTWDFVSRGFKGYEPSPGGREGSGGPDEWHELTTQTIGLVEIDVMGKKTFFAGGESLPAGRYRATYLRGAFRRDSFQGSRYYKWDTTGVWIDHGDGKTSIPAPGTQEYVGHDTVEEVTGLHRGESVVFDHHGGTISMHLVDSPYRDNVPGDPSPTYMLARIAR